MSGVRAYLVPAILAIYMPTCAPAVRPTAPPWDAPLAEFWQRPRDLATRDLYCGPWGCERAPDARDTYTFVRRKAQGTNPGVVVADSAGREWHVKQPPDNDEGAEAGSASTTNRSSTRASGPGSRIRSSGG